MPKRNVIPGLSFFFQYPYGDALFFSFFIGLWLEQDLSKAEIFDKFRFTYGISKEELTNPMLYSKTRMFLKDLKEEVKRDTYLWNSINEAQQKLSTLKQRTESMAS